MGEMMLFWRLFHSENVAVGFVGSRQYCQPLIRRSCWVRAGIERVVCVKLCACGSVMV